jgi:hypothetical protein
LSSIRTIRLDKAWNDHFATIGHCRLMCADTGGRPVGRSGRVNDGRALGNDAADEFVNEVRMRSVMAAADSDDGAREALPNCRPALNRTKPHHRRAVVSASVID